MQKNDEKCFHSVSQLNVVKMQDIVAEVVCVLGIWQKQKHHTNPATISSILSKCNMILEENKRYLTWIDPAIDIDAHCAGNGNHADWRDTDTFLESKDHRGSDWWSTITPFR